MLDRLKWLTLALLTTFIRSPPIATGGKSQLIEANEIRSSLQLSIFNLTLFLLDHSAASSAMVCALLTCPFLTTSDAVVSSTYFQIEALLIARWLIMIENNHGPSLVHWGTQEGTVLYSETHLSVSLILCERHKRKSIIQLIMLGGMETAHSFLTKMLWSVKSNPFL